MHKNSEERQVLRQADRQDQKERQQSEKMANREPSLQPFLVSGQQPAFPSIALREMEREEKKNGERRDSGEGDGELRRYRKKMQLQRFRERQRKGGKVGQREGREGGDRG